MFHKLKPIGISVAWSVWLAFLLVMGFLAPLAAAAAGNTYYVDADASGSNNDSSWANAYTKLQDALTVAVNGDSIWIAEGVYYRDEGTNQTNNDQNISFRPKAGVQLYGGFDPTTGADTFAERNWQQYQTIFSGDIDQNDTNKTGDVVTSTNGITGANSYHVFYLDGQVAAITSSTVLDGLVITAGAAMTNFPNDGGGGLYCNGADSGAICSPTLTNLF